MQNKLKNLDVWICELQCIISQSQLGLELIERVRYLACVSAELAKCH